MQKLVPENNVEIIIMEIVVGFIIEMICDVYIVHPDRLTEVYATCIPGTGGVHLSLLPRRKGMSECNC